MSAVWVLVETLNYHKISHTSTLLIINKTPLHQKNKQTEK